MAKKKQIEPQAVIEAANERAQNQIDLTAQAARVDAFLEHRALIRSVRRGPPTRAEMEALSDE